MIRMPAASFLVSEKAFTSSSSQASHSSSRTGPKKVRHPLHRCRGGRWSSNGRQRLVRLQYEREDCYHSFVATKASIASIERDAAAVRGGEFLQVQGVSFRPPGIEVSLLNKVSMSLPENSLGLVYGPSGSGKTTLLQVLNYLYRSGKCNRAIRERNNVEKVLGGLATPTEGSVYLGKDGTDFSKKSSCPLSLSARVGIVFQFPERELSGLVDKSRRMEMGGKLIEQSTPATLQK